jgi:hypothetical protein
VLALGVVGACGGDFTYEAVPAGAGGTNLTANSTADTVSADASGSGGSTAGDPPTSTNSSVASGASTTTGATNVASANSSSSVAVAASSGSGNGIECLACAQMHCPAAVACINDPACLAGYKCVTTKCINANQMVDYACAAGCFNNNAEAAKKAFDAGLCVSKNCQADCAGVL